MTRRQLGVLIGVSSKEVYRYERGERKIPAERVHAITRITGIAPEVLRPDIFGIVHDAKQNARLLTGTGT